MAVSVGAKDSINTTGLILRIAGRVGLLLNLVMTAFAYRTDRDRDVASVER